MFPKTFKLLWIQQKYYFRKNQQQICSKIRKAHFFLSNPRHTFRTSEPRFPGFWRRLFFLCVQGKWKKVHFSSYPSPRGREKEKLFWQARLGIETVDSGFRGFVREQFAAWLFWKVVGDQQVAVGFDIFGLKRFLNKQLGSGCFRWKWKLFAE